MASMDAFERFINSPEFDVTGMPQSGFLDAIEDEGIPTEDALEVAGELAMRLFTRSSSMSQHRTYKAAYLYIQECRIYQGEPTEETEDVLIFALGQWDGTYKATWRCDAPIDQIIAKTLDALKQLALQRGAA